MKKLYFLTMLLLSSFAQAQFTHLKPNQEVPEQVLMVMNDNTSKTGYVKNNGMDYVALRILSQDLNSFKHASVEVEGIKFKPEGKTDYETIPAKDIKHIILSGEDPVRFDRINVYRFKKKSLEVKDKDPAIMFQVPKVDDYLVMYSNIYINKGSGGSVHDQLNFFVRLKDSDITYFFNMIAGVKDKHNLPQFKILAKNNKKFTDYIDKLCDKKSEEYSHYYKLQGEAMKEVADYIEENKKLSWLDVRSIQYNARYRFMFYFIGKKLEEFSS